MFFKNRVRFDRNELAGSFGDIGTDLPLILGIISATDVNVASTFIMFGLMQIMTGIIYGIPMAVQPLKAMAVIVISQKVSAAVLYGGGLVVGIIMFFLAISGLLNLLSRIFPKVAIRGIQFGLGLSLSIVASTKYIRGESFIDYVLPAVAILIIILLRNNRKVPASLIVIAMGFVYAVISGLNYSKISAGFVVHTPVFRAVSIENIIDGFLILAIAQIPLSLSNSVVATYQTISDLFPDKKVSIKKIGITYSIMNFINPFFSGIPTCHGTGGLVGHYTFGARTGGSVIIYGSMYVIIGLFFADVTTEIIKIFPYPVLGVILLFEGLGLMLMIKDIAGKRDDLFIALLVSIIAANIKYGYLLGLIVGSLLWYYFEKRKIVDE